MIRNLEPEEFLKTALNTPVADVRSPSEYSQGQIPAAFNIPLFDDSERAQVGILYKNSGSEVAIKKGLEIAGLKISSYLEELKKVAAGKEILVHCWRGGMRSESMALLFEKAGYSVGVLTGGYKAYRHYIRAELSKPRTIFVLGGYTGSGKTRILRAIREAGGQVIDLEALANHKGSVFGALGQPPQPTNEQFENELYREWSALDPLKPVWIEDESRMIGKITLPDPFFTRMGESPLFCLETDIRDRIGNLVAEYAQFDRQSLKDALSLVREKVGGDHYNKAILAIDRGDFRTFTDIALRYYDKAYRHAISRRPGQEIHFIHLVSGNAMDDAERIIGIASGDSINVPVKK